MNMSLSVLRHPDFDRTKYGPSTVNIHAGEPRDAYGALVPPIYQTSTFYFDSTDDAVKAIMPKVLPTAVLPIPATIILKKR